MATILLVDDKPDLLELARRHLSRNGHDCSTAGSVRDAITAWESRPFDLVLCDLLMPDASGLKLVEHLSAAAPQTAVVVVTGVDEPRVADEALRLGAYGYLVKPVDPNALLINVNSALRRRELELQNQRLVDETTELVHRRTSGLMGTIDTMRAQQRERQQAFEETLFALAAICDSRDVVHSGHPYRVSRYATVLGHGLGITGDDLEQLRYAAALHDVGMHAVPSAAHAEAGPLTPEQAAAMREHTRIGARAFAGLESAHLKLASSIARSHHERWDGTGYPDGLAGKRIPIEARIVAVADAYDGLTTARPDRPARSTEDALAEIQGLAGAAYDPDVVLALVAARPEIDRIRAKYRDEPRAAAPSVDD
ncbi:MAG: response regulator [Myxococcales bacterium]|nr:response regulator [Myxococcales bacterium]MCB9530842.1 response regulator [Myxococcales bacterium]